MLAGASLVGVGTACFSDPYAPLKVIGGIEAYLSRNNIVAAKLITGKVTLN